MLGDENLDMVHIGAGADFVGQAFRAAGWRVFSFDKCLSDCRVCWDLNLKPQTLNPELAVPEDL